MIFIILLFLVIVGLTVDYFWRKKKSFLTKLWRWIFSPSKRPTDVVSKVTNYEIGVNFGTSGSLKLSVDLNITQLSKTDREFVNGLIDKMQDRRAKEPKDD
jgi:hypothetical protein